MNFKLVACVLLSALSSAADDKADKRFTESADVLEAAAGTGDKQIPKSLLDKAACIVVVPGLKKGGFIVAGQYGAGYASCRTGSGWSAPLAMKMEGGSVGLQVGGQAVDIVLLVMNEKGMDKLVSSKFTLGGEASVAAGPVGRDAEAMTDATMNAEILSYSRARGVFGGVSLKGSTLRPDGDVNEKLYGKDVDSRAVLTGKVSAPPASKELLAKLQQYSGASKP
jgi:lipid-binding SYLF domain-containing protein